MQGTVTDLPLMITEQGTGWTRDQPSNEGEPRFSFLRERSPVCLVPLAVIYRPQSRPDYWKALLKVSLNPGPTQPGDFVVQYINSDVLVRQISHCRRDWSDY